MADYTGEIVDLLRSRDYHLGGGRRLGAPRQGVRVLLRRGAGGRIRVPDAPQVPGRRVVLVGEIIHNPHVNVRLREMGIEILMPGDDGFDYSGIKSDDVVILPAFGVTITDFNTLRERGCVVVDTTCGSVLNVWKRVEAYARDGFTSLIHGKHYHEETRATASQVERVSRRHLPRGAQHGQTKEVCAYIEGRGDRAAFWPSSPSRPVRTSTPTCTCCASASPTRRRCWRGSPGHRRGSGAGDGCGAGRSVPSGELSGLSTRSAARRRIAGTR